MPESSQSFDCGFDNVRVITGAERFGQDILDARRFDHRPHTAPGNDTRSRRSRTQENAPAAKLPDHLVRNGIFKDRDSNHRFPGGLGRFAYRLGNLIRLAEAISHASFVVASDDQRTETKAASALNYLRAAVDEHHFLCRVAFLPTR